MDGATITGRRVPIAIFGAASFLAYGTLDWRLAIALGLAQGVGAAIGAAFGNRLAAGMLRRLVGWALVISAGLIVIRTISP